MTRALEASFLAYVGCRHALAVTSCTTGLEIALHAVGVGPGDEVIVPDFTFPATGLAVRRVGATAVLVDVDPATFLIDLDAAERALTPRTRAIIPVSEFGNPLDHHRLAALGRRSGVAIIEDAACAIGSAFAGRRTGSLADITVFSLHPRKFITTGEGGIITTSHDAWAGWMDAYKHFGITGKDATGKPVFATVGTNAKLSDLQAAVGVAQMEEIDDLLRQRQAQAARYIALLGDDPDIVLPTITPGGQASWQSFCVKVRHRDGIMDELRSAGIEVQFGAFALHQQPAFRPGPQCRPVGNLCGSQQAFDQTLALPLHHELSESDQGEVVEALRAAVVKGRVTCGLAAGRVADRGARSA